MQFFLHGAGDATLRQQQMNTPAFMVILSLGQGGNPRRARHAAHGYPVDYSDDAGTLLSNISLY